MFIQTYMTANPITINVNASIFDAGEIMRTSKIRRLPVVDDKGILQGIMTDRDVRKATPSNATTLDRHELNYLLNKLIVKDVMTRNVVTTEPESTIEEAALLMYKRRIGGLVVTDSQHKVMGIITETDIFKVFVDVMGLQDGKTRLTLDVSDRVGVLSEITKIFSELGLNIASLVTFPVCGGGKELVIRADIYDKKELLLSKLKESGYEVQHIIEIN